jgi:nucleoside-diphosphate-sugar epimerase
MSFRRQRGVIATMVRIYNTYGPRMDPHDGRAVPEFVRAALNFQPLVVYGNGLQTRSFCYVEDLVEVLLRIARDRSADGEVFNIGNPREVTVIDLVEAVIRQVGGSRSIRYEPALPDDPSQRRPDISKVQARYGWEPRVDLEEGLRRTVAHFRALYATAAK